jgi:hypothetical protein
MGRAEMMYCVERATKGRPLTGQVVRNLILPQPGSRPLGGVPGRGDQGQPVALRPYGIGRGVR